MNEDVDMDAPQISTLREEETPEPQPMSSRTSKFRVKLLVGENKRAGPSTSAPVRKSQHADSDDEEDEEEDDEEDQLIDDDDDDEPKPLLQAPSISAPPLVEKKPTVVSKRGAHTGTRGRARGRARGGTRMARIDVAPPLGTTSSVDSSGTTIPGGTVHSAPRARGRARGGGVRGAPRKRGTPRQIKAVPSHLREDAGQMSEGYAATAASSPPPDDNSPDLVDIPLPVHSVALGGAASLEDISLDGVALPAYPLPARPFPVHPPTKIGTGFAPVIPLDKSGKRVRHWRQANREIRGIAGGRWFAKSWLGDKDSDYATGAAAALAAIQQANAPNLSENVSGLGPLPIPRLPGLPTTGRGPGRPRLHRPEVTGTNPSSRAQSIDSISAPIPKKRTNTQLSTVDTPPVTTPAA